MKFGQYLNENLDPKYQDLYVNYKTLQKLIKTGSHQVQDDVFVEALEHELQRINAAFEKWETRFLNEFRNYDLHHRASIKKALHLQDFGEVLLKSVALNFTAVQKLLKKYDKRHKTTLKAQYAPIITSQYFVTSKLIDDKLVSLQHLWKEGHYQKASEPATPALWAYVLGTFLSMCSNNINKLLVPLVFLELVGPSSAAFITGFMTLFDSFGTVAGGHWYLFFAPRTQLLVLDSIRFCLAGLFAFAYLMRDHLGLTLTVWALIIINSVDWMLRGVLDTVRNMIPISFSGYQKDLLDTINARYLQILEVAALVGPLIQGVLLSLDWGLGSSMWLCVVFLFMNMAVDRFVPHQDKKATLERLEAKQKGKTHGNLEIRAAKVIWSDKTVLVVFAGIIFSQFHRLRTTLPQYLAKEVFHEDAFAAWLYTSYSAGCVASSLLYKKVKGTMMASTTMYLSAVGLVMLSLSWLPWVFWDAHWVVTFLLVLAMSFTFAFLNMLARMFLQPLLGSLLKSYKAEASGVMALNRFWVNAMGAIIKFSIGFFFLFISDFHLAFFGISIWLVTCAGLLVLLGVLLKHRLQSNWMPLQEEKAVMMEEIQPKKSTSTTKGCLITFEGLDGAGKSTQVENLRNYLRSEGYTTSLISWSSSTIFSEIIKHLKRTVPMRSLFLTTVQAHEFHALLKQKIEPALKRNKMVLCDRYYYTGVARGVARGFSKEWLLAKYKVDTEPDMVLYHQIDPTIAVKRVLLRSAQDVPSLSDDCQDHKVVIAAGTGKSAHISIYEAGFDASDALLDENKSDPQDLVQQFIAFQSKVSGEYDNLAKEHNFCIINGAGTREEQSRSVQKHVQDAICSTVVPHLDKVTIFDKDPFQDHEGLRKMYCTDDGMHCYYRNMKQAMQRRLAELYSLYGVPTVFLHGNPHISNYSKTERGWAMADFDRACRGPYVWDIIRFLGSVSITQPEEVSIQWFIKPGVLQCFMSGYEWGLTHPHEPYAQPDFGKDFQQDSQGVTASQAGGSSFLNKRIAEMREHSIDPTSPDVQSLLGCYCKALGEDLLELYDCVEAGTTKTWHRQRARYFALLRAKDNDQDIILLDFKPCVHDPDDEFFYNPYPGNEGKRMLEAAKLHAPNWGIREATFLWQEEQFYGRQVPRMNVKLKSQLTEKQQRTLLYSVGTQMGRAHAVSLHGATTNQLFTDLKENLDTLMEVGFQMRDEVMGAYHRYITKLRGGVLMKAPPPPQP